MTILSIITAMFVVKAVVVAAAPFSGDVPSGTQSPVNPGVYSRPLGTQRPIIVGGPVLFPSPSPLRKRSIQDDSIHVGPSNLPYVIDSDVPSGTQSPVNPGVYSRPLGTQNPIIVGGPVLFPSPSPLRKRSIQDDSIDAGPGTQSPVNPGAYSRPLGTQNPINVDGPVQRPSGTQSPFSA